jgi:hypothetical protein
VKEVLDQVELETNKTTRIVDGYGERITQVLEKEWTAPL